MAGRISALCLMGAEKAVSASIFSPSATATEPILLEVSTAKTKGFRAILIVLKDYILQFLLESLAKATKKALFRRLFSSQFVQTFHFGEP